MDLKGFYSLSCGSFLFVGQLKRKVMEVMLVVILEVTVSFCYYSPGSCDIFI